MARRGIRRSRPCPSPHCRPPSRICSRRRGSPPMAERSAYLRDGEAIYARSFAIIRQEADLARFSPDEAEIAVRMIHACGLVEAAAHIVFGGGLAAAGRAALAG